jgi:aminoglycoside phosphotransferase (APT) family kinase protein
MIPAPSPCDADRPLDVARVERTLHAQFPEVRLLSLVADAVSISVPRIEWFGRPGPDFPYPFVGYRLIPGTAGDLLPDAVAPDDERRVAGQIGRAVAAIHRVPIEQAQSLSAVEHSWDAAGLVTQAIEYAPSLATLVRPVAPRPGALRRRGERWHLARRGSGTEE